MDLPITFNRNIQSIIQYNFSVIKNIISSCLIGTQIIMKKLIYFINIFFEINRTSNSHYLINNFYVNKQELKTIYRDILLFVSTKDYGNKFYLLFFLSNIEVIN